ncbi:MAG: COX15/CtaA family protein [Bacilli bacterium]
MNRLFKFFAILANISMVFVLLGGALVTKTGSGQGCGPNWPLCYGVLIPEDLPMETVIELSHRITSFSAGIFVLIFSVMAWRKIGHYRETRTLAVVSLFFLIVQALLGAAAVVWPQTPSVLALHFGISLISYAAVFCLTLLAFEVNETFGVHKVSFTKKLRWHTVGILLYTYAVVYSGALVRHKNASLACSSFPFCSPEQTIGATIYQWIQMTHRGFAILLLVWAIWLTVYVYRTYRAEHHFKRIYLYMLLLLISQAVSGVLIVYTNLALIVALMHAFFITIFFGVTSYAAMLALRK